MSEDEQVTQKIEGILINHPALHFHIFGTKPIAEWDLATRKLLLTDLREAAGLTARADGLAGGGA